jgi:hypothetical protein
MNSPIAAPVSTPQAPPRRKPFFTLDNRYIAPAFITCILLAGNLSFGILESYQKTLIAIVVSIATELVLGRIFLRKWLHPASAYITGISVGILVRSPAFWPYAVCSAISITSKYVLRVKGRHIWNPSNFGISVLLFLAADTVASLSIQWGNYLWPMIVIWILGSVIIARLHRFHITAIYVISFLLFAFMRSWMTGSPWQSEVAPNHRPLEKRTMPRSVSHRHVGNGAAPPPGRIRTVLRPLHRRTNRHADRDLDGFAPRANSRNRRRRT